MLKRVQNWQLEFEKCVAENLHRKFERGAHDCALWAANIVLAITGVDVAKNLRGSYDSALGADGLIESYGGMEAMATKLLGIEPSNPLLANVGDVVLTKYDNQLTFAVCNGSTVLATGTNGLVTLPMSDALACWRI